MFGLGKKKKAADPSMDTTAQNIVPINLNVAHSFQTPPVDEYPAQYDFGTPVYSDQLGHDLPSIANQDKMLVHYFQPPAADNPQAWYDDRNSDTIYRGTQEKFYTANPRTTVSPEPMANNPWLSTPLSVRPTSTMSPSNWRFFRPYDQQWERTNSLGQTGSAAQVSFPYAVGGLQPQNILRNTFRLEPSARDIENMDLASAHVAAVTPAVYVSPQQSSSRWGL